MELTDHLGLAIVTRMTSEPSPTFDVFVNGQFYDPADANVSINDAGMQHAVGLFETLSLREGRVVRLDEHLARLQNSATTLGLVRELKTTPLAKAIEQTIEHNHLENARIRLTLTAGEVSMLKAPEPGDEPQPTIAIVPAPPTHYDPQYFEQGISAMISPDRANPLDALAGHKTLNYWGRLRTLRLAAAAGAGEAIWLSVTNHLASGAISNLFLVKDGILQTPIAQGEEIDGSLPSPVLPGTTRKACIDAAMSLGMTVERKMLTIEDLLDADEVMLTNSGWDVLPVTRVEKNTIGDGTVGEVARQLRHAIA